MYPFWSLIDSCGNANTSEASFSLTDITFFMVSRQSSRLYEEVYVRITGNMS
jgi:hypothetical protein